jgi:hypothetical protein
MFHFRHVVRSSKAYGSVRGVGRLACDLWPVVQSNEDVNVLSRREVLARRQAEQVSYVRTFL